MKSVIPNIDETSVLRALLAASGDCIKILDLDGKMLFMTEGGQRLMEVADFSAIRGCSWPDFWQGAQRGDAEAAVQAAKSGGTGHFVGPATTMAGTPKFWDVTVTLIRDADGKPDKLLSVSRDITATHEAQRAVSHSQQRLSLALSAADIGTWDFDVQNGVLTWDNRCYELFGISPGAPISWERFVRGLHPEDREATERACAEAMRPDGSRSYDIEYRTVGAEDNVVRWCSAKGRSFFAGDTCIRFIGTILDIGQLKQAEQQRDLLTHELEHRLKNTLSMVSAIAAQTFRTAATKEDAGRIFDARLLALDRAHRVLTRTNWTGSTIDAVIEEALDVHRSAEKVVNASGPPVMLSARQSMSLSLTLHELATNAAKYGALSRSGGKVDIEWDTRCCAGPGQMLSFRWQESGGPTVVPPTRKGFGSRLIANSISSDFGPVSIDYAPSGLVCSFECQMSGEGEPVR